MTVRVGVIGRGFGATVVAPAFERTEGCEVVDVISPRDSAAVSALCNRVDVDVISVHSPPFMHADHVRRAIQGGHAVMCDKPFGRDVHEAREMHDLAAEACVPNFVNFEMRFDPERERCRELLQNGAIGDVDHVESTMFTCGWRVPLRPYGWLFDADVGGGWLGAYGSHVVDFARWAFGEIVDVSGSLRTTIAERPDSEGAIRACTADDGFTAILRMQAGVNMVIDSSSVAPVNLPPRLVAIGTTGVLELTLDHRVVIENGDGTREEHLVEVGDANPLMRSMLRWAERVRDGVREGETITGSPTFADGLACRTVIDQLRREATTK